jgi:hypothetical protein
MGTFINDCEYFLTQVPDILKVRHPPHAASPIRLFAFSAQSKRLGTCRHPKPMPWFVSERSSHRP